MLGSHTADLSWLGMLLVTGSQCGVSICRDASGGWVMHIFALGVYQLRKVLAASPS